MVQFLICPVCCQAGSLNDHCGTLHYGIQIEIVYSDIKVVKRQYHHDMEFDPENHIFKLCAEGMDMEGKGKPEEASTLFSQAWNEATNDFEKFTAAHYVARHQKSIADKLRWDETALQLALKVNNDTVKGTFPSLYLNIAKCYEDLNDPDNAKKNYELALSFTNLLPDNGYGNMVKGGIMNGINRLSK